MGDYEEYDEDIYYKGIILTNKEAAERLNNYQDQLFKANKYIKLLIDQNCLKCAKEHNHEPKTINEILNNTECNTCDLPYILLEESYFDFMEDNQHDGNKKKV